MTLTLVIPCFNEERRIHGEQFQEFLLAQPQVRIIFVDDGSTDGTLPLLRTVAERAKGAASILALPRNGGKAEAVRKGMLAAMETGCEHVGFWDSDLATPLDAVADLLGVLETQPRVEVGQLHYLDALFRCSPSVGRSLSLVWRSWGLALRVRFLEPARELRPARLESYCARPSRAAVCRWSSARAWRCSAAASKGRSSGTTSGAREAAAAQRREGRAHADPLYPFFSCTLLSTPCTPYAHWCTPLIPLLFFVPRPARAEDPPGPNAPLQRLNLRSVTSTACATSTA
eukprot:6173466-Pleurochrysis_carterae.AAC.6